MNEVFWRFQKLSSIPFKSENEIYNFRVVPDLQISKKVDMFNDLHVCFVFFWNFSFACFASLKNCCKMGWEWSGEAETGSK